jgi:hypothetical protein
MALFGPCELIDRDEVTYTADELRAMKREHEAACARAVRTGSSADFAAESNWGGYMSAKRCCIPILSAIAAIAYSPAKADPAS